MHQLSHNDDFDFEIAPDSADPVTSIEAVIANDVANSNSDFADSDRYEIAFSGDDVVDFDEATGVLTVKSGATDGEKATITITDKLWGTSASITVEVQNTATDFKVAQ